MRKNIFLKFSKKGNVIQLLLKVTLRKLNLRRVFFSPGPFNH